MIKLIHRINTVEELKSISPENGVEVDIRTRDDKLILNHDPFKDGDLLDDFLAEFKHSMICLEVKEEGFEKEVIALAEKHGIKNYFLLSVTPPFMLQLANQGVRQMAVRFSEWEALDTVLAIADKIDWVFIDVYTKNPLTPEVYEKIKAAGLKICFVSPDRWDRADEIDEMVKYFAQNKIEVDAVIVGDKYAEKW